MENNNHITLDISSLLAGEKRIDIDKDVPLSDALIDGIHFSSAANFKGYIENLSGYMRLRASIFAEYKAECARCLKSLDRNITFDLEKTVTAAGTLENEEADEVVLDYIIVEDGMLDLTDVVEQELMLGFPLRDLCSNDCLGLCPKCGKNLNDGDCGCKNEDHDPRWDKLAELLKNNSDN